jgi:hypothetical protein
MPRPSIDAETIMMALDDHSGTEYFLDLETGEVVRFSADPAFNEDVEDEFGEAMENNPDRFRRIAPIPSSQSFQVIVDFVESLPESKAKISLSHGLSRSHPFGTFKDMLVTFPDIREKWFRYHDEAYKEFVLLWLQEEEIEADLRSVWFEKKA